MATKKWTIGFEGEELVVRYLKGMGYSILGRNIRKKFGEIDILARDRKGAIRFVEVKTMTCGDKQSVLQPEDNLSFGKLNKLKKICLWFANENPDILKEQPWQIDLVAVSLSNQYLEKKNKGVELKDLEGYCNIKFYENITN